MRKIRFILYAFVAIVFMACQQKVTKTGQYHSVDAESFKIVVRNSNVQVVDVRTDSEFMKGHIPNSINIDINEHNFSDNCRSQLDDHHPIAIYCHSGKRSHIAAGILVDMGYEIYELEGGILGWTGAIATGPN